MSLPPALLTLVASWGVDVAEFSAAYQKDIADRGYLPDEWAQAVAGLLSSLGATVSDPSAIMAALAQALVAGYNKDHGGLA